MYKLLLIYSCYTILYLNLSLQAQNKLSLEVSPQKIDLGTFNVGQEKDIIVRLVNKGDHTFIVERLICSCSCIQPIINKDKLLPGESAEISIKLFRKNEETFLYTVVVLPKETKIWEPVRIQLTGSVVQPFYAEVGWQGKKQFKVSKEPMDIGIIQDQGANLTINVSSRISNSKRYSLTNVSSTLSRYFVSKESKPGKRDETFELTLQPSNPLQIGLHRDIIELHYDDGSSIFIPLLFRVVGDIYGERLNINFDKQECAINAEKSFKVIFTSQTTSWPTLNWTKYGALSNAIEIKKVNYDLTNTCFNVVLRINNKVQDLPKGFLFSRIEFYNNNIKNKVPLLVTAEH